MSIFLRRFIENKKYIIIMLLTMISTGFLFGLYQYHISNDSIKQFFSCLFYLNDETVAQNYQFYVIQNGIYILICTYLSTSYLGSFGLLFFAFLKGIQFSFSLISISSLSIHFIAIVLIIVEFLLELLFCLFMNTICLHISFYVTYVTFLEKQIFDVKNMVNYHLNCLIGSLLIFSLALVFRIYIIPMF